MFEKQAYAGGWLLDITLYCCDNLLIVWHLNRSDWDGILRILRLAEERDNAFDHPIRVDVAHDNDTLVAGVIPLLIVVAQLLVFEVFDHVHGANGHASAIEIAGIEFGQSPLKHAIVGRCAMSPLSFNDSPLLINVLAVQKQVVAPIAEHKQT